MDDLMELMLGTIFLGLLVAAFVYGIIFFIPAALVTASVAVACVFIYSFVSPNSKRNQAKAEVDETRQLYSQACAIKPLSKDDYSQFIVDNFVSSATQNVALRLFKEEGFAAPPVPPPIVTGIEGGRYRDTIKRFINTSHDKETGERFKREVYEALKPFDETVSADAFFNARQYLSNDEIDELVTGFFGEHDFFMQLRNTLDRNFNEQDGLLPRDYSGTNCPWDYLKDTPLLELEYRDIGVGWHNRAAHTLILAGSGAGKTTLFKHMIANLLREDCCVIVMDSQSQLIEELALIELPESDLTWICPAHQLALNPFDCDPSELNDETIINNRISLLEFVIENLIEAPMTPRQKNLFYYCTQLVLAIPGGNIETFKEVLRDPFDFADHIDELDESARNFFNIDLRSADRGKRNSYDGTREELAYRLDGLTKQPTFRRILRTKENTFDFYSEMEESRLILLDTSQALLSEQSATLGRFFVAQALQACFERVRSKATDRPVYFFIDEAHEVFDEKLERMLLQARKANCGMILAVQDLAKATRAGITDTLIGSTATKIISQVIVSDARKLAPRMKTSAEFLTDLPQHVFAFSTGDQSTVTVKASSNPLSSLEQRDDLNELRKLMEYHYGPEPENDFTVKDVPSGKYGPNDELKPQPKHTMSDNEDHDIKPADAL